MNITFNQNEELNYEAEFKVDSDFNLHIERVSKGPIYLMQRGTSEGEYSNSTIIDNNDDTLDYDFAALVYPKWIKVVSGSEVVSASVNFNEGGGSGSGSGEASSIEYLDVSGLAQASTLAKIAISVKWSDSDGGYIISPWGLFSGNDVIFKAIAIDSSIPIYNSDFPTEANFITLGEFMTNFGMPLDAIPRITKEEFYNLEA